MESYISHNLGHVDNENDLSVDIRVRQYLYFSLEAAIAALSRLYLS